MSGVHTMIRQAIVLWRSGRTTEQMRAVDGARIVMATHMVLIVPEPVGEDASPMVTALLIDEQGYTVREERIAITDG
jgi:hypothetical protein